MNLDTARIAKSRTTARAACALNGVRHEFGVWFIKDVDMNFIRIPDYARRGVERGHPKDFPVSRSAEEWAVRDDREWHPSNCGPA